MPGKLMRAPLQILQAFILPFAIIPMLRFLASKRLMGEHCISSNVGSLATPLPFVLVRHYEGSGGF